MIFRYHLILYFIASAFTATAQEQPEHMNDTMYYGKGLHEIISTEAPAYYREPAKKEGEHYSVTYRRIDNSLFYTAKVKAISTGDGYSIDPNKAIKDGFIVMYHPNGKKRFEGVMSNGNMRDTFNYYTRNGLLDRKECHVARNNIYVIKYQNSGLDKQYEGSQIILPNHKDTLREGDWVYYYRSENRIKSKINYSQNLLLAVANYYDSATGSTIASGFFSTHGKTGEWKYYDIATGKPQLIMHFLSGVAEGDYTTYYPTTGTVKMKGVLQNGIPTGIWQQHYQNGHLMMEIKYKMSEAKQTSYDSTSGAIIEEGSWVKGMRDGKWTTFYADAKKVRAIRHFKNNLPDGPTVFYDINGDAQVVRNYRNGEREGTWKIFYPGTGKIMSELFYKNDTVSGINSYYMSGKAKRKFIAGHTEKCFAENGAITDCTIFEQPAAFKGDVMDYIGKHLRYPPEAKELKLSGKVKIGFVIDEFGKVTDPYVVEGFDINCDNEALAVVSDMPLWMPATIEGLPITSYHVLPIVFWAGSEETPKNEEY